MWKAAGLFLVKEDRWVENSWGKELDGNLFRILRGKNGFFWAVLAQFLGWHHLQKPGLRIVQVESTYTRGNCLVIRIIESIHAKILQIAIISSCQTESPLKNKESHDLVSISAGTNIFIQLGPPDITSYFYKPCPRAVPGVCAPLANNWPKLICNRHRHVLCCSGKKGKLSFQSIVVSHARHMHASLTGEAKKGLPELGGVTKIGTRARMIPGILHSSNLNCYSIQQQ